MIVGIDEAGRGPLAGPVVACALACKKRFPFPLKDSKKLSASKREEIFSWILDNCYQKVAYASKKEVEKLNIAKATYLAAERAIIKLIDSFPFFKKAFYVMDGITFKTRLNVRYTCLKKADEKIVEVACASIVAKVTRDYMMQLADFIYPEWDFGRHKGYPTRKHFRLIAEHSISPFHRRNFIGSSKRKAIEAKRNEN